MVPRNTALGSAPWDLTALGPSCPDPSRPRSGAGCRLGRSSEERRQRALRARLTRADGPLLGHSRGLLETKHLTVQCHPVRIRKTRGAQASPEKNQEVRHSKASFPFQAYPLFLFKKKKKAKKEMNRVYAMSTKSNPLARNVFLTSTSLLRNELR